MASLAAAALGVANAAAAVTSTSSPLLLFGGGLRNLGLPPQLFAAAAAIIVRGLRDAAEGRGGVGGVLTGAAPCCGWTRRCAGECGGVRW